jgi:formylglycine-generating enzyme required for sulfatase activity
MMRFAVFCLSFFLFAGGASRAENGHAENVAELIERTLKNMVFVEGGAFMMGDQKTTFVNAFGEEEYGYFHPAYTDARPAHEVVLKDYYLGKFEVTFGEHDVFSAATGREPTEAEQMGKPWRQLDTPAYVNWQDAHAYCAWLGEQTGLPMGLPTEAQWEFAARSRGKVVPFATDTGYIDPGVNYTDESNRYPYPPGIFPPNPLGLYDMSGNISEWVADWYAPDYYTLSPRENPQGPQSGEKKVYRGGSVFNSPGGSSTVIRGKAAPDLPYASGGFRCAINTGEPLPVD